MAPVWTTHLCAAEASADQRKHQDSVRSLPERSTFDHCLKMQYHYLAVIFLKEWCMWKITAVVSLPQKSQESISFVFSNLRPLQHHPTEISSARSVEYGGARSTVLLPWQSGPSPRLIYPASQMFAPGWSSFLSLFIRGSCKDAWRMLSVAAQCKPFEDIWNKGHDFSAY